MKINTYFFNKKLIHKKYTIYYNNHIKNIIHIIYTNGNTLLSRLFNDITNLSINN